MIRMCEQYSLDICMYVHLRNYNTLEVNIPVFRLEFVYYY